MLMVKYRRDPIIHLYSFSEIVLLVSSLSKFDERYMGVDMIFASFILYFLEDI